MRYRLLLALLPFCAPCFAGQVSLLAMHTRAEADGTRVELVLDAPVRHSLFTLAHPDRVVLDLTDTRGMGVLDEPSPDDPYLARVRSGIRHHRDLRVVFDLKHAVQPRSFLVKAPAGHEYKLIVELRAPGSEPEKRAVPPAPAGASARSPGRDVLVAIDPGHGGHDPGTIGPDGVKEKNVTLAIARILKRLVDRQPGMRAMLTRTGDYYVGLRHRMQIARAAKADLFVSIHADSCDDPHVRGASVYALSRHGASSEAARWLAARENGADRVGGVSLDDKDNMLASVLLNLSQTATMAAGTAVGTQVLDSLRKFGLSDKSRVEHAGFVVLKSPDIPSILVETAYLSSRRDEHNLQSPHFRRRVAAAILAGVKEYLLRHAPAGTVLAARRHIITRGDTLADVAQRYHVPLDTLRAINGIKGNRVYEGEVLHLPPVDNSPGA